MPRKKKIQPLEPIQEAITVQEPIVENDCEVCSKPTLTFLYGKFLCGACSMTFRRHMSSGQRLFTCKSNGLCYSDPNLKRKKCSACKMKKCLEIGITTTNFPQHARYFDCRLPPIPTAIITEEEQTLDVLDQLKIENRNRRIIYKEMDFQDDSDYETLVMEGSNLYKYTKRQDVVWKMTEWQFKPWCSLGVLLAVEIIKSQEFYGKLLHSDKLIVLKKAAFKSHRLCAAYDSFLLNSDWVVDSNNYPFGSTLAENCHEAVEKFETALLVPLNQLNMREEEFLLLNMIVICNPAHYGISPNGRQVLYEEQCKYSKLLLQSCKDNDPIGWLSRYIQILEMDRTLEKQKELFHSVMVELRKSWRKDLYYPKVLEEVCKPVEFVKCVDEIGNEN